MSWVVFALVLYVFLVHGPIAVKVTEWVLAFQFAPALMKALAGAGVLAGVGCVAIVLATLVFGRLYCACFCPLGILQDLVFSIRNSVAKRFKPLRKAAWMKSLPDYGKLRYPILIATVFFTVLGSAALLDLLDPYSLFGRLATAFLTPIRGKGKSLIASILERYDIYALSNPDSYVVVMPILAVTAAFFVGLLLLVLWRGRIYCNTICPVGTLLGLLAKAALVRVRISQAACNHCGACELRCRAGCIDTTADEPVDVTRCVACFDCLDVCKKDAVTFGPKTAAPVSVEGRRHFILGSATVAAGVAGLPLRGIFGKALSPAKAPVMPPGSVGIEHISSKCTACHLCVSTCPEQVIRPAMAEYGMRGIMQPVLNFMQGECAYECNTCSQVCPTGAIKPITLEEKKRVRIGKVRLMEERCIVYEQQQDCGACAEVCPTHAVYTVENQNILFPKTRTEPCVGCGACQFICPVLPKAIMVDPLAEHETADPPFKDEPQVNKLPDDTPQPKEGMEAFPF